MMCEDCINEIEFVDGQWLTVLGTYKRERCLMSPDKKHHPEKS